MKKNQVFYISIALISSFTFLVYTVMKNKNTSQVVISNSLSNPPSTVPVNLSNPFIPPLRSESVLVPINVSTNIGAVDSPYRQVGILKQNNQILPLMGRPLITTRNKWQYYSMSDKFNTVRLSVIFHGRNAMNEYGIDQLCNRECVHVEGYDNTHFQVSLYESDTIRYLPFL